MIQSKMIHYIIKYIAMNICVYYTFNKISNISKPNIKQLAYVLIGNILTTFICTYIEFNINSFLSIIIMTLLYGTLLSYITKIRVGYSMITIIISYAICTVCFVISTIIGYFISKMINIENYYIVLMCMILIQYLLVYLFFKIKRLKNGFDFLYKKFDKEITDTIVIYSSLSVTLIICLMGSLFKDKYEIAGNLFVTFIILGITMFVMIQRTLTMHYKQIQLLKTMEEYKEEIKEKDAEIKRLSDDKYNTSKIRHEFYHRQKALEMLVTSQYNGENIPKNANKNILDIINNLTAEYSKECERIKQLEEIDKTDIPEIDSMFKYMQNECSKNNIEFKLKITESIFPLVNNIISKSKLETLIGDHIKDAINAVNNEQIHSKDILVILGKKNKCYEFSVHDTGIEFEIDTLLKLGKERVSTCLDKGGSGIGFLTTFETLKETKASLIITENKPSKDRFYTKSVTIRFDGKQQFKIVSYRSDKIKAKNTSKDMLIEKI